MRLPGWLVIPVIIVGFFVLTGCKNSSTPQSSVDNVAIGKLRSDDPTLGAVGNSFTCITCHQPFEPERRFPNTAYPSYDLQEIAYRSSYWGDTLSLRSAVNRCIETFMQGRPLTVVSDNWVALLEYLQWVSQLRSSSSRTIVLDTTRLMLDNSRYDTLAFMQKYRGGDSTAGAIGYLRYCNSCHGYGKNGASDLRHRSDIGIGSLAVKVRLSATRFKTGTMPFFTLTVLTPDTLRDIIAYIRQP